MSKHFFDVGASVGQTFEWYLNKHPEYAGCTVWCFEPSARLFARLEKEAARWSHLYKIILCPFGLSNAWATPKFFVRDNECSSSFFQKYTWHGELNEAPLTPYQVWASTVPISEFIFNNIPKGDEIVVKVDAEGSEYAILQNILAYPEELAMCSRFLVEWHGIEHLNMSRVELMAKFAAVGKPLEEWEL